MTNASEQPQNGPESPHDGETWVSVSEAAAAAGVSEKTIWRRAKKGQITARKVAGAHGGFVWEIAPDSTGQPTDRPDSQPTGQTQPQKRAKVPTDARTDRTDRPDKIDRPTGHDEEMTLRLLTQLETENSFLRATVEQLQRDGAETRAALREALKLAPKAITAGSAATSEQVGTSQSTRSAPKSSENRVDSQREGIKSKEPQNGSQRAETSLSYDDIADMLEREMQG